MKWRATPAEEGGADTGAGERRGSAARSQMGHLGAELGATSTPATVERPELELGTPATAVDLGATATLSTVELPGLGMSKGERMGPTGPMRLLEQTEGTGSPAVTVMAPAVTVTAPAVVMVKVVASSSCFERKGYRWMERTG